MDKVEIGFPIEYECDDGIIRNGLFLREPETKELEKRLKEINEITDLKEQVKKQKEVIDKAKILMNKRLDDMYENEEPIEWGDVSNLRNELLDILKEVSKCNN